MYYNSDYTADFVENCVETCSHLMKEYCVSKKSVCGKVSDVIAELGGIYSFHPVFKNRQIAEGLFDYYREKLIEYMPSLQMEMYFSVKNTLNQTKVYKQFVPS